jgi:hypothetical protein
VFARADIHVDDNFFEIGGHSLMLVKLHAKLLEIAPKPIGVADYLLHPTIRAFARFLEQDERQADAAPAQDFKQRASRQRAAVSRRKQRVQPNQESKR